MNNCEIAGMKKGKSSRACREKRSDLLKNSISCSISNDWSWNSTPSISMPSISNEEYSNSTTSNSPNTCPDQVLEGGKGNNLPTKTEKKIQLGKGKFRLEFISNTQMDVLEVVAKGTRFMKSLNFSTVIVKLRKKNLKKSMIYYVIAEPATEESRMQIPCIMFSNPYAHTDTRFAELLPLYFLQCSSSIELSPMLVSKRYRRIFRRGCSFNIRWFKAGRAFDCSGGISWKMCDMRNRQIRNLIQGFVKQDINKISLLLTKMINPPKLSRERRDRVPGCESRAQRKANSSDYLEFEESSDSLEITRCKLWGNCENKKLFRTVREERGIIKDVKCATPQRCVYKPRCDEVTTFRGDSYSFKSVSELDKYWHVSGNAV